MKTSYKWIKDLVPGLDVPVEDYCHAMTMSGTKVEFFEKMDDGLEKIIIGQITKIEPHPDADKLVVCQVNLGDESTQIVTGATNVFEGAKVPVVLSGGSVATDHDGNRVPGGNKIKAGKLRGIESNGMMCSIIELGSDSNMFPDADEDGIYILKDDAPVGADAVSYIGLDDTIIEYEVTSNRVDCFSVLGIGREAAATFGLPFAPPQVPETGNSEKASDYIKVTITDPNYCKRFVGRVVKNIKLAPSPEWLKRRLVAQGIRPINNIVDITNYVMEEYGQPMHAYDLDTIEGGEIIVRNAKDGEEFITLDGQTRMLDSEMCMINDAKKAIGLAGIMGGENTMITDNVNTMLFEAACFIGPNIRQSAKRLGMRTEASSIFEKGLDPENALAAINRACALVEELGAGEVVGGCVDIYPVKPTPVVLPFEPEKYNRILGTDISKEDMIDYLGRVEIKLEGDKLMVPTFRQDVEGYADIAEEVARFYGYDNIPETLPISRGSFGGRSELMNTKIKAASILRANGFSQAYLYSFESPKVFDKLLLAEDAKEREAIVISNPLGEDFSIMRTTPVAGLLTALGTNSSRRNGPVRLYELGKVYLPKALPLTELPDEPNTITFGMYGQGDFFDIKGVYESILKGLGYSKKPRYENTGMPAFLHPGRSAMVRFGKEYIGYIGQVHPTVASNFDIKGEAYVALIYTDILMDAKKSAVKYKAITNFPKATRDLSMLVPHHITAAHIEEIFMKKGGKHMEEAKLFDLYEGAQVEEGYKSMAYTLTFRADDRSLSEEDISGAISNILSALEKDNITLRK